MENAKKSVDAKNLNSVPELLLLGGGTPIFKDGILVGGIGVSGGGGGLNDHNIAIKAAQNSGFTVAPKISITLEFINGLFRFFRFRISTKWFEQIHQTV